MDLLGTMFSKHILHIYSSRRAYAGLTPKSVFVIVFGLFRSEPWSPHTIFVLSLVSVQTRGPAVRPAPRVLPPHRGSSPRRPASRLPHMSRAAAGDAGALTRISARSRSVEKKKSPTSTLCLCGWWCRALGPGASGWWGGRTSSSRSPFPG